MVDNPDNERDTCLVACSDSSAYLLNYLFDVTAYSSGTITPSEFYSKLTKFIIYGNAEINQCRQSELMSLWNLKLSYKSYTYGLLANLASQAAMYNNSPLYSLFHSLKKEYDSSDTQEV
jgi:hypothetical protein